MDKSKPTRVLIRIFFESHIHCHLRKLHTVDRHLPPSVIDDHEAGFHEDLKAAQLIKKFFTFMEPRDSLPCLQEPTTIGPYSEQEGSDPEAPPKMFKARFHICLDFPSSLLSSSSTTKMLYMYLSRPCHMFNVSALSLLSI